MNSYGKFTLFYLCHLSQLYFEKSAHNHNTRALLAQTLMNARILWVWKLWLCAVKVLTETKFFEFVLILWMKYFQADWLQWLKNFTCDICDNPNNLKLYIWGYYGIKGCVKRPFWRQTSLNPSQSEITLFGTCINIKRIRIFSADRRWIFNYLITEENWGCDPIPSLE